MTDTNSDSNINVSRALISQVKRARDIVYQLRRLSLCSDLSLEEMESVMVEMAYLEVEIIRLTEGMTVKLATEQSDGNRKQRSIRQIA